MVNIPLARLRNVNNHTTKLDMWRNCLSSPVCRPLAVIPSLRSKADSECSEGSRSSDLEILRCAQDDSQRARS